MRRWVREITEVGREIARHKLLGLPVRAVSPQCTGVRAGGLCHRLEGVQALWRGSKLVHDGGVPGRVVATE